MDQIISYGFIGWLTIAPLIVSQGVYESWLLRSFWIVGLVLALNWFRHLQWSKPIEKLTIADHWYIGWLLIVFIASIFGVHPIQSIIGESYRHQGIVFFLILWLIQKLLNTFDAKKKRLLSSLLALIVFGESLFVIMQFVLHVPFPAIHLVNGRAVGTFGEPNAAAGFLAVTSIFIFGSLQMPWLLEMFLALIIALGLYCTGSRAGMVSFLIVIIGIVGVHFFRSTKPVTNKFISSVFFVSILVIGVVTVSLGRPSSIYEGRAQIWSTAVKAIANRPILGYGAESGESVFNDFYAKDNIKLVNIAIERAHNIILDVAMWSGLMGLVFFVVWLVVSVKTLWVEKRWANVVGVASWLIFASLQPVGTLQWALLMVLLE